MSDANTSDTSTILWDLWTMLRSRLDGSSDDLAASDGPVAATHWETPGQSSRPVGFGPAKGKRIAVIGGGAVAVSYVHALVSQIVEHRAQGVSEIMVFEPRPTPGPGYAYQFDACSNLLNTRADTMSAVCGEPRHFLDWLSENREMWISAFPSLEVSDGAFLPRSLFGMYLADVFADAQVLAQREGIAVRHIRHEVIDMIQTEACYCLDTAAGGGYAADIIVLALGNLPSTTFPELTGTPGFINSPYPTKQLCSKIPKGEPVCIIGANLSAIDSVIALSESGHQGKLSCVSRSGRLPSVRGGANIKHHLKYLTREALTALREKTGPSLRLEDVAALLCKEIAEVDGQAPDLQRILKKDTSVSEFLSSEIQASVSNRTWQSVVYATNSVIDLVWHALAEDEKRRFFAHVRSQWFTYRVSYPLENAIRLRDLMARDALAIYGGFTRIEHDDAKKLFRVHASDRARGIDTIISTKWVVNATGCDSQVETSPVPLVRSLLRRAIAVADPFGGFRTDFATGRLLGPQRGGVHDRIYALGSVTTGTYFWTNAMDVNARLALNHARHLVTSGALASRRRPVPIADRLVPVDAPRSGTAGHFAASSRESETHAAFGRSLFSEPDARRSEQPLTSGAAFADGAHDPAAASRHLGNDLAYSDSH